MAHKVPDRFWWLPPDINELPDRSSSALITELFILYNLSHTPSPENQPLWNISVLFMVAYLIILVLHYFRSASRRRKRFRQRCRALQGYPEVLFLAAVPLTSNGTPQPSELLWSPTYIGRVSWLTRGFFSLLLDVLLIGFGSAVLIYFGILHPPAAGSAIFPLSAFLIGMIVIETLVSITNTLEELYIHLSKEYGIASNAEGIWWYPPWGKKYFLRWEEFSLFEVEAKRGTKRKYRLYGHTAVVEWSDVPPSKVVSLGGLTLETFWEVHQALLNLIVRRTQLLPRTLDEKLAVENQSVHSSQNN